MVPNLFRGRKSLLDISEQAFIVFDIKDIGEISSTDISYHTLEIFSFHAAAGDIVVLVDMFFHNHHVLRLRLLPAHGNRGLAYSNKSEYDKAIKDYTEAIRLDPELAMAYGNRGLAYAKKGEYDKSIEDCTVAIRLDSRLPIPYLARSTAYASKGDHDQVIKDCTEAIRLKPDFAAAFLNRGRAYFAKGDQDKADADFAREKELRAKE